jgi:hypothetical protein
MEFKATCRSEAKKSEILELTSQRNGEKKKAILDLYLQMPNNLFHPILKIILVAKNKRNNI